MRRLPLLVFLSFLLLCGCSVKKPVSVGCCILNESSTPPSCSALKGSGPETTLVNSLNCDKNASVCNVTIRVTIGDASNTSVMSLPVCPNTTGSCFQGDCVGQLCGNLHYNPTPVPSYKDSLKFEEEARETGGISTVNEIQKESTINLYGASCQMLPANDLLNNFLKNSKGSFINTFRFGVGGSFDDFDRYRWFFPSSDSYCNANPFTGTKERYSNYLLSPAEFETKMGGGSIEAPEEKVASEGFCLQEETSPFLAPTYEGGLLPGYRYHPISRLADKRNMSDTVPPYSTIPISFNYSEFDKKFYVNFLNLIYDDELEAGTETFSGVPVPAPFECQSSMECGSGYCNYQDYNRMLCRNRNTGKWVRCGCDQAARKCLGQTTALVYHNDEKPDDAQDLLDHYDAYEAGEVFFTITKKNMILNVAKANPSCDWYTPDGIEDIEYPYSDCEYFPDGSVQCGSGQTQYEIICNLTGGSTVSGCHSGIDNSSRSCTYDKPDMSCDVVSPYHQTDCVPTGNTTIACQGGATACTVSGSSASCTNSAPGFDGTLEGCSYNSTLPELNCTLKGQKTYTSCIEDGNLTKCGALSPSGPASPSTKKQFLDDSIFQKDIYFFGRVKSGYIGYSMLREDKFKETDFAQGCQLQVGVDYDVVAAVRYDAHGDDDGETIYTGKMYYPPPPIEPDILGNEKTSSAECNTFDDDWLWVRFVPNYILIKNTGVCELDLGTSTPKTKSFGWCEPCSYATLAKQSIVKIDPYNVTSRINYTGFSFANSSTGPICNAVGSGLNAALNCPTTDDPENANKTYKSFSFNAYPDSVYLQEKQTQYLKEGVMPVFDITDASDWALGVGGSKLALNNTIIARGPSVLIVFNLSGISSNTSAAVQSIKSRITNARASCPTCQIALRVTNGAPLSMNMTQRVSADLDTLDAYGEPYHPGFLTSADLIVFGFFPNEYDSENADACSTPMDTTNGEIFDILENESREIMVNHHLPTMATEFYINQSGCWNQTRTKSFLSYTFLKQKRLAKSALLGIIYSNTTGLVSGSSYSENFCGVEKGSHNMVADEPVTVFNRVYTMPQEQVKCEGCNDFDVSLGKCNRTCPNGLECTADAEAISLAKVQLNLPADTPDANVPLRCPEQIMPEPCPPCAESSDRLSCTFFRSDGTIQAAQYNVSQLTLLEADVIASIPPPHACCISDETGNFTFVKQSTIGKITAPIIFSYTGDPRQDCGVPDFAALEQPVCEMSLPIKNYKVECNITG